MSEHSDAWLRRLMHDTADLADPAPITPRADPPRRARLVPVAASVAGVALLTVGIFAVFQLRQPDPDAAPPGALASTTPVSSAPASPITSCPAQLTKAKVTDEAEPDGPLIDPRVTSMLVCAYGPNGALTRSSTLGVDRSARLASIINGLPAASRGFHPCRADAGGDYLLIAHTPHAEQSILVESTGCRNVTDGRHLRQTNEKLLDILADS